MFTCVSVRRLNEGHVACPSRWIRGPMWGDGGAPMTLDDCVPSPDHQGRARVPPVHDLPAASPRECQPSMSRVQQVQRPVLQIVQSLLGLWAGWAAPLTGGRHPWPAALAQRSNRAGHSRFGHCPVVPGTCSAALQIGMAEHGSRQVAPSITYDLLKRPNLQTRLGASDGSGRP